MNEPTDKNKGHLIEFDEPFVEAKATSAAVTLSPKLPKMMRKAGRVAGVYALSYLAVKGLNKAAEVNPDNKLINGVDQIANVVFGFENLAVGGTLLIAEAGYDALTAPSALQQPALVPPEPKLLQEVEPSKSIHPNHKPHRNRAPLNAKLAPDVREPAPPLFADVGIQVTPVSNGAKTAHQPHPTPKVSPELKPQ